MTADMQNDTELWQLARENNRNAYEMLYRRYMKLLFVTIHKRIPNKKDAEDLTQDIFLTLWEKRKDIILEGRFFSYIYRTAQNRVLNYFRDNKIPAQYLEIWENLSEDTTHFITAPVVFEAAELLDMEQLVEEARQRLPFKMRQVYELRYEQHLTTVEISEQLVISPNTVRNHLKEVRKRFTSAIKKSSFFLLSLL
ncbi:RNA polymerase sigma factor [Chitinophaga nivalis]|uniref:Sigma-70 family RNA polymerase sigma factor n=1 Tax=Chitinophaga nivalis TaxID=2991709 RepID=A0ABT3IFF8_9BACT|nr:sigma-70 family RNA polymerase sigma factor [Chitinophaga nivalis]MCW3467621.1 sigma-70 family RNA polymerase sigma factor [Chitinophaga nivalis]MCW3482687.1 sigma-70 family RNA polymerase sigma factor [Chitinophaga nivalis]